MIEKNDDDDLFVDFTVKSDDTIASISGLPTTTDLTLISGLDNLQDPSFDLLVASCLPNNPNDNQELGSRMRARDEDCAPTDQDQPASNIDCFIDTIRKV